MTGHRLAWPFRELRVSCHGQRVFCKTSRIGAAALAAAWLFLAGTHARAAIRQSVDLRYDVDPALRGCPKVAELRGMLAERLGYDPYREGASLAVDVRAVQVGSETDGIVRWHSANDNGPVERHFSAKGHDCRELVATMAFVVAVQLELMAKESEGEVPPAANASDKTDLSKASDRKTDASPAHPASETLAEPPPSTGHRPLVWSTLAGGGPALGVGLAPTTTLLGRLFGAVELPWAAVELAAEASLPTSRYQDRGGGFRHQLFLGSLAACGRHLDFEACAVGKLGFLQARGLAVDNPASPMGLLGQVGPRVAYSLNLGEHLALMAHVDAMFLLTPWRVQVNGVGIWTMPRFGAVAGIDLAVRFR